MYNVLRELSDIKDYVAIRPLRALAGTVRDPAKPLVSMYTCNRLLGRRVSSQGGSHVWFFGSSSAQLFIEGGTL